MTKIVVTGATGLIGSTLVAALLERGDHVVALSRDAQSARQKLDGAGHAEALETVSWAQPTTAPPPAATLAGADAVVHLLGEPIAQRWTPSAKQAIRDSRVLATEQLVSGLRELAKADRPQVLVSQSATGYYGPRGNEPIAEETAPGDDFLAGVVVAWEQAATAAESMMRVVRTRTGVVLAADGGALGMMLPFFKLGIGGPVAGGQQYVPWIHLDDVVGALIRCVDDATITGALNLTAPTPVRNSEFSHALGRALHRPAFTPVPGFALKLMYGEMSIVVTTGQRAVPAHLESAGYAFAHPDLDTALRALLGSETS
jgi:uncharacterized protein